MQIVVVANQELKDELTANGVDSQANIAWIEDLSQLVVYPDAAVIADLVFDPGHTDVLKTRASLVIINSVTLTLKETDESFVRINGWPTFLRSSLVEAACLKKENKQKATAFFSLFNKTIEWLPDTAGFVTPRVISMIINEAFIALEEGVSTREEINTAMKLGTNYPFGPFEWVEQIGSGRVQDLLQKLNPQQQ
jgi:3-hydroxybutyryl-CoA dehydrogenase